MKRYKNKPVQFLFGAIFLLTALFMIFQFSNLAEFVVSYLEENFSPDNHLKLSTVLMLNLLTAGLAFSFLWIGLLLLSSKIRSLTKNAGVKVEQFLHYFIDVKALMQLLLRDAAGKKESFNKWILTASLILCFSFHIFFLFSQVQVNEGIIEHISAGVLFVAILVLVLSLRQVSKNKSITTQKRKILLALSFITLTFFFILGEELSWGQHIFSWKATGVFENYNYQKETNLHNFINPLLPLFYPLFGITGLFSWLAYWLFPGRLANSVYRVFIPPPVFFIVIFYMAASGFLGESEMFETFFSIFALLYGLSLYPIFSKSSDNYLP